MGFDLVRAAPGLRLKVGLCPAGWRWPKHGSFPSRPVGMPPGRQVCGPARCPGFYPQTPGPKVPAGPSIPARVENGGHHVEGTQRCPVGQGRRQSGRRSGACRAARWWAARFVPFCGTGGQRDPMPGDVDRIGVSGPCHRGSGSQRDAALSKGVSAKRAARSARHTLFASGSIGGALRSSAFDLVQLWQVIADRHPRPFASRGLQWFTRT